MPKRGVKSQKASHPAQKDRLKRYRQDLVLDRTKIIFDDKLVKLTKNYVWSIDSFTKEIEYLNELTDDSGFKFSRSLREWKKLRKAIEAFFQDDYSSFRWNRNYQKSLKQLKALFRTWKLKSLKYVNDDSIRKAMPKTNTHSGYTYIETGRKKKGDNMDGIFARYCQSEAEARKSGSFNRPMLCGTRTQGSGAYSINGERTNTCKHKTRLVLMVDILQIIAELIFAKPLQDMFATLDTYAGGSNDDEIRGIINDLRSRYQFWMSLDYSNFDASVSRWLIEDAFSCLKEAFIDCDEELWNIIVHDFIHKDFVVPEEMGGIVHVNRGVPSGSMFTQIIDTTVNWIVIMTYLNSKGIDGKMIVMGDDNLLYTQSEIDRKDVASYISKNFGMEVSPDKTTQGRNYENPEFLSRTWRVDDVWRHPNEIVMRMAFPERFRPYGKQDVTPAEVLFGYILTYPAGMRELMDVNRFLHDFGFDFMNKAVLKKVDDRYISGSLAFRMNYLLAAA